MLPPVFPGENSTVYHEKDNNSRGELTSVKNYYHCVTGNFTRERERGGKEKERGERGREIFAFAVLLSALGGLDAFSTYARYAAKVRKANRSEKRNKSLIR